MAAPTKKCSGSRWQKVVLTEPHPARLDEFAKDKFRPDGLALICRPCRKVYETARRVAKAGELDPTKVAQRVSTMDFVEPPPQEPIRTKKAKAQPIDASTGLGTWIDPQVPPPAMAGWVMEQVGGDWLARPDSAEAVGSPDGQRALEAINLARAAVKRQANTDARRRQRAAAKDASGAPMA